MKKSFNLPDFLDFEPLEELRRIMSAPLLDYFEDATQEEGKISSRALRQLQTTGITVDSSEIELQADGTFTYQGVQVLLYIFAPTSWSNFETQLPKFHLCNCITWKDMKQKGRQDRYVASTRIDGLFELEAGPQRITTKLDVCKNCLQHLNWKGYKNVNYSGRTSRVQNFSISEFFERNPSSLIRERPRWTDETKPSGSYTDDFNEISSRIRAEAKWKCYKCKRSYSYIGERGLLHVHHKNGVKGDNRTENLTVLCLGCHAEEPSHHHMKNHPSYLYFIKIYGTSI